MQATEFADRFHRHALSLPCSVGISENEVATVTGELERVLDAG